MERKVAANEAYSSVRVMYVALSKKAHQLTSLLEYETRTAENATPEQQAESQRYQLDLMQRIQELNAACRAAERTLEGMRTRPLQDVGV
ncbi:Hypothetical protein POVN_LOCUS42 [uncultured virus]|nr:Hypothetical protein POVN_LOCUS42 [uncultured virus]